MQSVWEAGTGYCLSKQANKQSKSTAGSRCQFVLGGKDVRSCWEARGPVCSMVYGFTLNKWVLMGERLIGPVHCLLRCQAQPVGLAEFSRTALFLAGRKSKVRRRTLYWDRIWWVMRPSPAHRKTKSSHPFIKFEIYWDEWKANLGKIIPQTSFQVSHSVGGKIYSPSASSECGRKKGDSSELRWGLGQNVHRDTGIIFCSCSTCCAIEVMLRISAQEYSLHNDQWALLCI